MENTAIRVLREPRVTLIARQQFIPPAHIGWNSDSDVGAQAVTEFAGRLCYLSFGQDATLEGGHKTIAGRTTNQDYLTNILKTKHGSVLEHAVWSLLLEGISRSLTHELVRHRAGLGYSQLSQRYVDESNIAFVVPPELEAGSRSYQVWEQACAASRFQSYRELLQEVTEKVGDDGPATMRKKRGTAGGARRSPQRGRDEDRGDGQRPRVAAPYSKV